VRVGYRRVEGTSDDPSTGFSFGLGAHYGPVNLDYAMTPDNGFADIHRLSFGYTFGGTEAKPEKPEPKKEPVRPPQPKGPPVIVSAPAPKKAAPEPERKPEVKAEPAPKPAETLVRATEVEKSAPAPSAPKVAPKPSAPDQYEVVLGSYQSETSAQSELKALRILGFQLKDAVVTQGPNGGYMLSLARLNSKAKADDLAKSLIALSFTPRVEIARR
jgi:cell division protein FtsN